MRTFVLLLIVASAIAAAAVAQDFGFGGFGPRGHFTIYPNTPYDGRFTFVRVNYETAPGGYWYRGWPAWAPGYPRAEQNLMRSMNDLQKGGFVIVDDFKIRGWGGGMGGGGWDVFEANMRRVLPDVRFFDMDASHQIFHCFFEIDDLEIVPQAYNSGRPIFKGVYEDNDPAKRLIMIINYNTDISQFWEWSGTGLRPIDQTNEAYKLGVNYIVYGLTH